MTSVRKQKKNMIIVEDSGIHGKGVFASNRIKKGKRIIEYLGEIITVEEEERRYSEVDPERHQTYLFEIDDEITIDATVRGNDARYINHSCSPNCESINVNDRIFIEAICTIEKGEELTYDYSFVADDETIEEAQKSYPCKCGAPDCRKTILNMN